ncbi:hypothetical protein BH23CHL2_BH23CHL2_17160 [soil metagenome]
MTDVLSGFVLVAVVTVAVYGVDAAVSEAGRARWLRHAAFVLATALVVLGTAPIVAGLVLDESIVPVAFGVLAAGLVLLATVSIRGRALISRILPIDRNSLRAWVGLVVLMWLVIFRLVTFYGANAEFGEVTLTAAAIQTLTLIGVAFGLIGLFVRRGWRESLVRLGFTRIQYRTIAIGVVAVVPMAIFGALTVMFVDYISPGTTDRLANTVDEITGGESSLGYGLALGIFAAVGEETLFRGAIQPKYGLVFTSLVFAVLHVQYDLLLVMASLFPVGLILGLERKYLGTAACIVTHALYNTLAVVIS